LLRAWIVNFRSTLEDIRSLPDSVVQAGRDVDRSMQREGLSD
jgi:hypothetical protein